MANFNFGAFVRECYLRSTPSVDLDKVTNDNPVKCSDHRLSMEEYDHILTEFGVTNEKGEAIDPNSNLLIGCSMWMLQSGPQLYHEAA